MNDDLKKQLGKIANTIKQLSIEAVQKANSGHPGLPLGCAEFGAFLYGYLLRHNPKNPKWLNRDRFVLSAGHGSMLLYSCLHLSGFRLSLDDIKKFRQLHSKTPGHPEYRHTEGVEATTGPLGQGVATAVGQALGLKLLAKKFNRPGFSLFDNKVYCLAGDGCIMEGISSEASSLAGHLGLDNLVLIYDSNRVCLDGPLSESCSEDTMMRYKAYGWEVYELDGYDFDKMKEIFDGILKHQTKPCFIKMNTVIGHGSPNKAGTHKVHGSPLGDEELKLTKQTLGLPEEEFYVPQAVRTFFEAKCVEDAEKEHKWKEMLKTYADKEPLLYKDFNEMVEKRIPENLESEIASLPMKNPIAGRSASQEVLAKLGKTLPYIYGGSADLSCSDLTLMKDLGVVKPKEFEGRNIKFGVREFAMGAMAMGLAQTDMIIPYVGTFFTFSDYMRNAIRLAALSGLHVVYQFTHDSIFLGEDGPTHQSVEQLASLRAMPGLHVIRPCDSHEVKMAWIAALKYQGPTAIVLSRQAITEVPNTNIAYEQGMAKGAYIVKRESKKAQFTLFATGSEVSLAVDVANALEKLGKSTRVVSMPCWELFEKTSDEYKESVVGGDIGVRVCIEAGCSLGWHKWIGRDGIAICIDTFGASAPAGDLASEYGFTVDSILDRLLS